jgi:hypothetical protein
MPSNLGVGKHQKEVLHGYCGRRKAAGRVRPTGKERHKGSFPGVLRRHVRYLCLAVVLPAFYAYYQAGLEKIMPFEYTALPLLVIGAILIIVGAAWGPETRDVDFSDDVQEAGKTGGQAAETSPRTTAGADRAAGGS